MEKAHEEACKTELAMPALVEELKRLKPEKAETLDARLAKYKAGLPVMATYTCIKMDVGVSTLLTAYTKLVPGYNSDFVFPAGWQHPILV